MYHISLAVLIMCLLLHHKNAINKLPHLLFHQEFINIFSKLMLYTFGNLSFSVLKLSLKKQYLLRKIPGNFRSASQSKWCCQVYLNDLADVDLWPLCQGQGENKGLRAKPLDSNSKGNLCSLL